jgi:uncharacterized membrane protein YhaH (DUF805 family)
MAEAVTPRAFVGTAVALSGVTTAVACAVGATLVPPAGAQAQQAFLSAWATSWAVAFPVTVLLAPVMQGLGRFMMLVSPAKPMSRSRYLLNLAVIAAAFVGLWNVAHRSLPELARLLNPYGINGGLALNALLVALLVTVSLVFIRMGARRLADGGYSRWFAVLPVLPVLALLAWSVVADWVFLWSHRLPFVAGPGTPADWTAGFITVTSAVSLVLIEPARPPDEAPAKPEVPEPAAPSAAPPPSEDTAAVS